MKRQRKLDLKTPEILKTYLMQICKTTSLYVRHNQPIITKHVPFKYPCLLDSVSFGRDSKLKRTTKVLSKYEISKMAQRIDNVRITLAHYDFLQQIIRLILFQS